MVAPALEKYREQTLLGDVWKRPGLTARDRSIVTLAALIARNQTTELPLYLSLALDSGVKPREISEIITHLAFYAGWGNAASAIAVAKDVFDARKIGADQLSTASPALLPLNEAAEAERAKLVGEQFGTVAPGLVQNTTDVLFRDLWLRPDLAPRDRSLVTVSALVAMGQVAQIPYHLNRAMDDGLTKEQAGEALTHLAFYVGWPNAFSALPVFKDIFQKAPPLVRATISETVMPHVIVKLWPGKSELQKQKLAAEITKAVMDTLHYGEGSVSVAFEEVAAKDWMAKVYTPDIRAKPGTIYKKPGYTSV